MNIFLNSQNRQDIFMDNILDFKKRKEQKQKITMVTCYDHWTAKILGKTQVDSLLVGDSVAMVVHGFDSTIHAHIDMMAIHTAAVTRAKTKKLIITDLPFLAHRKGIKSMMKAVEKLMKSGAGALKIEATPGQENSVRFISESGVPVIGHLGLTPQSVHQLGGYRVQGKDPITSRKIFDRLWSLNRPVATLWFLNVFPWSWPEK